MKIVKKLSPIMESISNVGKDKKKLREELDINHPIGVLPHADAVATEQHIADRAAGLERRANPDKDPLVKELIDETASAKSRTLHYDVVDRKGLAKILTEAKKNKQKFKVGKSDKLGYRYFVDILPIYGSKGALEVDDDTTEVDGEETSEALTEDTKKLPNGKFANVGKDKKVDSGTFETKKEADDQRKAMFANGFKESLDEQRKAMFANGFKESLDEDIEKDLRDYIKWCKENGREPKDGKSLDAYFKKDKALKEAKYKIPMNDSEDYINAMYKAYKELSKRKGGYAAVYGYRKGKTFVPFLALKDSQADLNKLSASLKTREKGQNDVIIYTLFKDNLEGAKELLKQKGLLKESLSVTDPLNENWDDEIEAPVDSDFDEETDIIYQVSLINYPDIEEVEEFDNQADAIKYAKENQADYDEVVVEKITTNYIDREDRETIYEDGKELDHYEESLDEDLQVYTSSLKDFKPAKEAEPLWNEIIEKGKMDDLEYALENVFKSDEDKNASIDIEGLNDLLVNHEDFIRTLIGLDDAPLEDKDYDSEDVEPVDNDDLIVDDDEEEPVDADASIDDEDDEDVIDYKTDKIEADDEEDIEPLTDAELANEDAEEYPEAPKYVDEEPKEEKKPSKWTKREGKVEEALGSKEERQKKINALRAKLKEDCECDHPCDKEPELKLEDEEDDLKEDWEDYDTEKGWTEEDIAKHKGKKIEWAEAVKDSYNHFVSGLGRTPSAPEVLEDVINNYDFDDKIDLDSPIKYDRWVSAVAQVLNREGLKYIDDDDLTESVADAFVKSRVTEAKPSDKQAEYDSLVKKTLPLLESDEEVVDISDDEINEMVGAPTEADVKKDCKECDEKTPVKDKKPLEEACEEKKEEIKEEVKPTTEEPVKEDKKVEECKEQPIKEECKDEKAQ